MAGTDFNFTSEHVQKEIENGEYISTESTILLAGPSQLNYVLSKNESGQSKVPLFPIGLIGSIVFEQNRQIDRLYEIGSKRAYFIPNRLRGDYRMTRTLFYGPSLLRLLYALAPVKSSYGRKLKDNENTTPISDDYNKLFGDTTRFVAPGTTGLESQENRDFWINMMSELFNIPFGMGIIFKDSKQRSYAAMYMEDAYVQSHSVEASIQNVFLAESISGTFDRLTPFHVPGITTA